MTSTASLGTVTTTAAAGLRRAAVRAMLAPSVHNTQPWRFALSPASLEIWADWDRHLTVLDPSGRQLLISCGCALFNARVAAEAAGVRIRVERNPDPVRPELLARITLGEDSASSDIAALDPLIELRQTNRRRFADDDVPADLVAELTAVAAAEGALLVPVERDDHRLMTASLSQQADRTQNADPAYRAELRRWTTDELDRRDGVPSLAVPHVDGTSGDDLPIRDFDTHGAGWLPVETHSHLRQCLLILGTTGDTRAEWLRAGEALERVLLEITRHGYVASPLTQVMEVPRTRSMLRRELGLRMQPHILLRVGRAPVGPASRRRRLVDVIMEQPSP